MLLEILLFDKYYWSIGTEARHIYFFSVYRPSVCVFLFKDMLIWFSGRAYLCTEEKNIIR